VFAERTGYGTPTFAARKMEVTPGFERVELAMDPSGFVEARIGASPHGQGLKTTLAQLLADEIGIAPDRIRVISGDTDRTPYGWGTFASRSRCSPAAPASSPRSSCASGSPKSRPNLGSRRFRHRDRRRSRHGARHRSRRRRSAARPRGLLRKPPLSGDRRDRAVGGGDVRSGRHVLQRLPCCAVEVDIATGHVAIERFVVVEDAGILINPTIVEGQIHGGVAQGIANALYEEVIYDDGGNILTGSLADYLVPTMAEIPDLEIHHLETITDASITGVKGVGEGGAIGAPGAVLNAVVDALRPFGIEVFEMPITPQRIRQLLRDRTSPPR
jgi:carbon-monoxide dehydrogenase large subunit